MYTVDLAAIFDKSDPARYNEPHDVLHIEHRPLPGPATCPVGRTYCTVVRKDADQPPLSVNDIKEMIWLWRPISTEVHAWSLLNIDITTSIEPRCIKIIAMFISRGDGAWRHIIDPRMGWAAYHAAYDEAAPLIDGILPRRWSWFATRVMDRLAGKQVKWTGRKTPVSPVREEPLYLQLKARIEALATADDAIWGSAQRFSVPFLARDLGMPRRTFERRIAEWNTGVSPADIIQDIRLSVAHELLPTSSTVKAVANRTGYSQSHFTKLYRPRFGVNPSERTR